MQKSESHSDLGSPTRRKIEEILEIFLKCGYYRVLVRGLTNFDRIVGGLAWCVVASGNALAVDRVIQFHESANIGFKIALAEQITAALVRMNCPHLLEAHQIQGLDLERILPTAQWLHIRVQEMFRYFGDRYRRYALQLYRQWYPGSYAMVQRQVEQLIQESIATECAAEQPPPPEEKIESDELIQLKKQLADIEQHLSAQLALERDEADALIRQRGLHDDLSEQLSSIDLKYSDKKLELSAIDQKLNERQALGSACDDFRRDCKQQLHAIKADISATRGKLDSFSSDNQENNNAELDEELAQLYQEEAAGKSKLKQAKAELYKLSHKALEIPSSNELLQYQKRCMELYGHLESESETIRQLYTQFNAVQNLQTQFAKETKLINAITDSFTTARHSKQNQDRFIDQITDWMRIANGNLQLVDGKRQDEANRVEKSTARLQELWTMKRDCIRLEHEIKRLLSVDKKETSDF